jgi:hypothetical protein
MIRIKLALLSAIAVAFARPIGFSTANAAATDAPPTEEKPKTNSDRIALLEQRIAAQDDELARLRTASPVAIEPGTDHTTQLLIKGAGVKMEDVGWRIRAGLSPAQAVEVALTEKTEADSLNNDGGKK